ncbi:MAG TPA: hypothetical protein VFG21_02220 [Xanthomonadaceae bacterium]|nr:hypothetical protein [Xanthomonadaceae bacterium]
MDPDAGLRPKRIVASLGLTAEDVSILGELLQAVRDRSAARWSWGPEKLADVVLFDERASAANLDRLSPGTRRVFVARSGGRGAPQGAWQLTWPPTEDSVLDALEGDRGAAVAMQRRIIDLDGVAQPEEAVAVDMASLFDAGMIADVPSGTLRAADERAWQRPDASEDIAAAIAARRAPLAPADNSPAARLARRYAPLCDFIAPGGLPGPARLDAAGMPALVVDPGKGVFHCAAALSEFDLPMLGLVGGGDWTLIGEDALQRAADEFPARPVAWLQFIDAMLNPGMPANAPGADARCRLTDAALVEQYPQYERMLRALTQTTTPAGVAEHAGTTVEDALHLCAALDAAGLLTRNAD